MFPVKESKVMKYILNTNNRLQLKLLSIDNVKSKTRFEPSQKNIQMIHAIQKYKNQDLDFIQCHYLNFMIDSVQADMSSNVQYARMTVYKIQSFNACARKVIQKCYEILKKHDCTDHEKNNIILYVRSLSTQLKANAEFCKKYNHFKVMTTHRKQLLDKMKISV